MFRIRTAAAALTAMGLFALSACAASVAQTPGAPPPAGAPAAPISPATNPAPTPAAAAEIQAGYRLDTGDQIKITVFDEAQLSSTFEVDGTGTISMPLIGEVEAKNLTVRQLQRTIEEKLRNGFLRDPQVSAEVVTYRPFYIRGEVNKPGQYAYTNGMTVLMAVTAAGDFTYRADKGGIMVKPENADKEQKVEANAPVRPGDTIRVKQRLF